ncbi:MAG: hypothetical protein ACKVI4_16375, partial [Actinomycetales bacterium]
MAATVEQQRQRLLVQALAAPFHGSVPRRNGNTHVVLPRDATTRAAVEQVNFLQRAPANFSDRQMANASDDALANMYALSFIDEVDATKKNVGNARHMNAVESVAQLARLDPLAGEDAAASAVTTAAGGSGMIRNGRESPVPADAAVGARPIGRTRVRRGNPDRAAANIGALAEPTAAVAERSKGLLALSRDIASRALRNAVYRETVDSYRHRTLVAARAAMLEAANEHGHMGHVPDTNSAKEWEACSYDVTLRWRADGVVNLQVAAVGERPDALAVTGHPWAPCVALVHDPPGDGNRELLLDLLEALDVRPDDDAVDTLKAALAELFARPAGVQALESMHQTPIPVSVPEIAIGTPAAAGGGPPGEAELQTAMRSLDGWQPVEGATSAKRTDSTVVLRLTTCPLLAATSWPIVYDGGYLMGRAIEDYSVGVAHERAAPVDMADAVLTPRIAEALQPVTEVSMRVMTLLHSASQWHLSRGDLDRIDLQRYVEAVQNALADLESPIVAAKRVLMERRRALAQPATLVYHPCAWLLTAPLEAIEQARRRLLALAQTRRGMALKTIEFRALRVQLGRDVGRFNTIYLGIPVWTTETDSAADLYEAALNCQGHLVARLPGVVAALRTATEGTGEVGDRQHEYTPIGLMMGERAKATGFTRRAIDRVKQRYVQSVAAHKDPATSAAVAAVSGMGAHALRTPQQVMQPVYQAIMEIEKGLELQAADPSDTSWDSLVTSALRQLEHARDAVATAWMQVQQRGHVLTTTAAGSASSDDLGKALEAAYALVKFVVAEATEAAERYTELALSQREGESVSTPTIAAQHVKRSMQVLAAKLAVAATRVVPEGDAGVPLSPAMRELMRGVPNPASLGAKAVLDTFRRARIGGATGTPVTPDMFDAAFSNHDPSRRISMLLDAAYIVVRAVHMAAPAGSKPFDLAEVERRLDSPGVRSELAKCPPDEGMLECVSRVFDYIGRGGDATGVRGFQAAMRGDRRSIARVMCVVGGMDERRCRRWMERVDAEPRWRSGSLLGWLRPAPAPAPTATPTPASASASASTGKSVAKAPVKPIRRAPPASR